MIFFSTAAPARVEELDEEEVVFFSDFCPGAGVQWSMWYCRMMLFFKLLLQFSQRTFSLLLDSSFSRIWLERRSCSAKAADFSSLSSSILIRSFFTISGSLSLVTIFSRLVVFAKGGAFFLVDFDKGDSSDTGSVSLFLFLASFAKLSKFFSFIGLSSLPSSSELSSFLFPLKIWTAIDFCCEPVLLSFSTTAASFFCGFFSMFFFFCKFSSLSESSSEVEEIQDSLLRFFFWIIASFFLIFFSSSSPSSPSPSLSSMSETSR